MTRAEAVRATAEMAQRCRERGLGELDVPATVRAMEEYMPIEDADAWCGFCNGTRVLHGGDTCDACESWVKAFSAITKEEFISRADELISELERKIKRDVEEWYWGLGPERPCVVNEPTPQCSECAGTGWVYPFSLGGRTDFSTPVPCRTCNEDQNDADK